MAKTVTVLEGILDRLRDREGDIFVVGNDVVDGYLVDLIGQEVIITITYHD